MTCRVEGGVSFIQKYNAENRTSSIVKLETGTCASPGNYAGKWDFAYDGDGVRMATLYTPYTSGSPGTPVLTTYYFGGLYELTGSTVRKYYSLAGQMVAMKEGSTLSYLLADHLGSTMAVLNTSGAITQQQRYLPFGQVRTISGSSSVTATDSGYTFQRNLPEIGLMDYKARFYSPALGRFSQPDTIIPSPASPQSWNRFTYVVNNPIRYDDPDGRCVPACAVPPLAIAGLAVVGVFAIGIIAYQASPQFRDAVDESANILVDSISQAKRGSTLQEQFSEQLQFGTTADQSIIYPNRGGSNGNKGCLGSAEMVVTCGVFGLALAVLILNNILYGQDERPSDFGPTRTPTSTSTTTAAPTSTATANPMCIVVSNCSTGTAIPPNLPTRTSTNTATPTLTPTRIVAPPPMCNSSICYFQLAVTD